MNPLVVEILRGSVVESRHLIDAVVFDESGRQVAVYGDEQGLVFPRSAIKPIQALPFVLSGACDRLTHPEQAIALACSSHHAEPKHLEVLKRWHWEIGIKESDLVCGPQPPEDEETRVELIRTGLRPSCLHNNCSGKHSGLLSACKQNGFPLEGYEKWEHPVQGMVRKYLTRFSNVDHEKLIYGIDGCGLPTSALPLAALGRLMSVFLQPDRYGSNIAAALRRIQSACAQQPWLLGGETSLCSQVGALSKGRVLAKIGAEGNYVAVLFESGLAFALKARDGAYRASEAALYELLAKYAGLEDETLSLLRKQAQPTIENWAGESVGSIRIGAATSAK